MNQSISRFRNLADWPDHDWKTINIHLFIAANFNRYCSGLIKKIGLQYLPSDATDSMMSLFCDIAYKPLKTVHEKNLDAVGNRRNQIMLGTLKMITNTRMVDALIKEYPSYVALEQMVEFRDEDNGFDGSFAPEEYRSALPQTLGETTFFAAETCDMDPEETDLEAEREKDRITVMLEMLRSYLTPVQYRHIRYAVCEGLSSQEIADRTGHSVTNVRIMLLNARKKMLELVPPHLTESMQEFLHRK
ncbi:RNA polymerase sigma factor [Ketobacter sp.]|uniref:RNA polymerase sigma factor n=1 Tax=Ketobacter sp. TaxID=2083498 RepID=UPI000F285C30|nr:sigma factor-like helix-turn-helix DNA-binding protein [Ketobacter sp.]RLT92534.1 MAG: sigma-70 family RNA polymerase sigma factor [Ketobacter sp.]